MSDDYGLSLTGLTQENHEVDIETFPSGEETDTTTNVKLLVESTRLLNTS